MFLKSTKHKALIVDFRKQQKEHAPIHINGAAVEKVEGLSSSAYTSLTIQKGPHTDSEVKKVQQRLFNIRRLKKFVVAPKTLTNFYKCTIESILWGCITA